MLTIHGRKLVAASMYDKGKAFIGAAILLRRQSGHPGVVLHLLCQGIEVLLKAILLRVDYKTHQPRLKRIGHILERAAAATRAATGWHLYRHSTGQELAKANEFYMAHLLRYASGVDILIDPATIPSSRLVRHTFALLRLLERRHYFSV